MNICCFILKFSELLTTIRASHSFSFQLFNRYCHFGQTKLERLSLYDINSLVLFLQQGHSLSHFRNHLMGRLIVFPAKIKILARDKHCSLFAKAKIIKKNSFTAKISQAINAGKVKANQQVRLLQPGSNNFPLSTISKYEWQ
jgi:hypothetical protein